MTTSYYLPLTPPVERLREEAQAIAARLLDAPASGWSEPAARDDGGLRIVTSAQGAATLRIAEPLAQDGAATQDGWVELSGFEGGGAARWVLSEPGELRLTGLQEADEDAVWQLARAAQNALLRDWVRGRVAQQGQAVPRERALDKLFGDIVDADRVRVAQELPRVAQPPYAPDDFPVWLYEGELSSLARRVDEADAIVAGVARPGQHGRRLLIRPLRRLGWQTLVPVAFLPRAHRFGGGDLSARLFASAQAVCAAIAEPLGRLEGAVLKAPQQLRQQSTEPSALYIGRWGDLEQRARDAMEETRGVSKAPGHPMTIRALEVTCGGGLTGRKRGLIEVHVDGLRDDCQVFVTGERVASGGYQCRAFCTAPAERAPELAETVARLLS